MKKLLIAFIFIDVFVCSAWGQSGTQGPSSQKDKNNPVPLISCNDLGGESGWGTWVANEGYHKVGVNNEYPVFFAPIAPLAPRFTVTAAGGNVPCTPGAASGAPIVPLVYPGFGNNSILIGQPSTNGLANQGNCSNNGLYPPPATGAASNGCSEQLTNFFTVTAQDTNFVYAYAILIENPPSGHTATQAPFAEIYMLDGTDTVPCSHRKYTADLAGGTSPGFYVASCAATSTGASLTYKPWTIVGINLKKYISKTLKVVIVNSDCALGGHACWSYWDFKCGPFTTTPASYCIGNSVTISAPVDPTVSYTYSWSVNGRPYTGAPGSTSQTIIPYPNPGDTFAVLIHQPSGCDFRIIYVPTPMTLTPNFSFNGGCGAMNFTDLSTAPGGVPMIAWNWSFPGGTPSSSTAQNPANISYPPGTYTVTLIVTSQNGCIDTISQPITVTNSMLAAFTSNPVCAGLATQFTNSSTPSTGVTWNWSFPGGTPATSTLQNPTVTYPAGTYSATLIIAQGTCTAAITHTVVVNPLPAANFTSTPVCLGNTTCFNNLSTISSGNITGWSWNFGDPSSGTANTSPNEFPCHLYPGVGPYNVVLTVTSNLGCQSSVMLPAHNYPLPVAAITPQNICFGSLTHFTDASTSPASDPITAWSWNFGDGNMSSLQNPSHTYATSGTFTITLIVTTNHGCKDTTVNVATIYPPPVANFSGGGDGCAPVCVLNYTDLSTSGAGAIVNWAWSFPGGSPSSSSAQNPGRVCYNTPGSYGASLVVTTQYGCKDTLSITPLVFVRPWPKADFCVNPLRAPATNPVFTFCDQWSSDVVRWTWNFGDASALDTTSTDPTHSYSATATQNNFYNYTICLRVENQYGCSDSICKPVELLPEFTFYIPNCFTPNGDFIDEEFFGKCRGVKEYDIWVFDRWGNQLWSCHKEDKNTNWDNQGQDGLSSDCRWDGKVVPGGMDMSGKTRLLSQEDVYVWKVRLMDIFDKRHAYIGHVSIVR